VINFIIERRQIEQLKKAIAGTSIDIRKELAVAVNKTAKATVSEIAKDVTKELNTTQAAVKYASRGLEVLGRATFSKPGAIVRLKRTGRMSLRHFKPKQNAAGVTYKISKSKGNSFVKSAFMGPRPGAVKISWKGNVFKRTGDMARMKRGRYAGKVREQITKLHGASPWGVYIAQNFEPDQVQRINDRLRKEMEERIRFRVATQFNKAKPKPKGA
jgi:hypothetical protein